MLTVHLMDLWYNKNLRDHPSKTMAISMLRITFNLLWLVLFVPCQAVIDCNYGKYWETSYRGCLDCSPCPKDVILGTSWDYSPVYECKKYKSLCLNWCSFETRASNPNDGTDACRPTTPLPSVHYVNATFEERQYTSTANASTVLCTASYRDTGTRTLEWFDPSGQLLAPNDTSGKWKVTEEGVTPEVMSTTLLMKDFKEGFEGLTCAGQGAQSYTRTTITKIINESGVKVKVNITIEEPQYNSTANACTVSCTASYRDIGTRTLEWYDPSGQLLAPNDTSGKWKVTEEGVTPEVMSTTLLMKDFKEGDEGYYTCAAWGAQSDNRTIFLEYDGLSTPSIIGIAAAVAVGVAVVICLSFVTCAFLILKLRYTLKRRPTSTQRSRVTVADTEAHALTGYSNNFVDKLNLETSDFKSAMVKGIQACLDQSNCEAVIIKKNGEKIGKVRSNQDAFFIEPLAWNDSIEVWMEYPHRNIWMKYLQGDNELIKTLKMKCLKIGNIAETSALIYSPSVENTFYMRFEETNAPDSSSSSAGPVDLMCCGSKEMCNLRPSVTYCVQLGIRGQTGDSGDYKWHWTEEFTTRSITVQSVTSSETSAKLTLNEYSIPESVQLYCEINQAKPMPMKSAQISISSLIPGMEQVLQIKVKENVRCTPAFRLLQEKIFTTSGSVEDGGDYRGCATTDCPNSDPEEEVGPSNGRRKKPSRTNVPTKCHTGLLEAIHALQDSDKFKQVYLHTEQCVLQEAVLDSLMEFLKDHKDFIPNDKYVLNANRKQRGMEDIEGFMKLYAMQDYTGIFDLLKRFIRNDSVHTQAGVSFAEQLLDAHSSDLRTCQVCKHAVYLLRRYAERHSHQPSVC